MRAITLYEQNRHGLIKDLSEVHRAYLSECLKDVPDGSFLLSRGRKVAELEAYLDVNYVDRDRDLSAIESIKTEDKYTAYGRRHFQPLLDALAKGDFELAEALTPAKYRLCGYHELKEMTRIDEAGIGWAGQYTLNEVPAGIYPIFVDKFHYHEANGHYTNETHSLGVVAWFEGTCVGSDSPYFKDPKPNVVWQRPYSHSLSHNVLDGVGTAHLIYPFRAFEQPFTYEGKDYVTYKIEDMSIPYKVEANPLYLRGRCKPQQKPSLSQRLQAAESKQQHSISSPKQHADIEPQIR